MTGEANQLAHAIRGTDANGEAVDLDFRLTVGLRKVQGQWTVVTSRD